MSSTSERAPWIGKNAGIWPREARLRPGRKFQIFSLTRLGRSEYTVTLLRNDG